MHKISIPYLLNPEEELNPKGERNPQANRNPEEERVPEMNPMPHQHSCNVDFAQLITEKSDRKGHRRCRLCDELVWAPNIKHHVTKCDVLSSAKRIANQEYAALSSVQGIQIPMELSDGTMSRRLSVHMIPLVRVTNVDALEKRLGAFAIASVEPESDVNLLIDGNKVGTPRVAGKDGQFRVELHGTNLEEMQRCGQKLVSVTSCQFSEEFGNKPFPYLVPGPEDPPRTLSEVYKNGYYTWDLHAMSVL